MQYTSRPAPGYSYTVQSGDTLQSIAKQAFGDDSRQAWQAIYNVNRSIIGDDPHWMVVGQILHIPVSPKAGLAKGPLRNKFLRFWSLFQLGRRQLTRSYSLTNPKTQLTNAELANP